MDNQRNIRKILQRLGRVEIKSSGIGGGGIVPVGTFTPTYLGLTTPGVTTYTTQQGAYIRIGKVVIATATIQWTNATGTGNAIFSLPFTSANVTDQNYAAFAYTVNVTFANSTPQVLLGPNSNVVRLSSPLTNAAGTIVAVEAAGIIAYTVIYFVD